MVLDLVAPEHPILKQTLEEFDFKNPPVDPIELANNLIETMAARRGLGLSASQCGLPYRVFVLWSETPTVCFNPRIIDTSSETNLLEEGCLTFPHLLIKIKRPSAIKVRFEDERGQTHTEKYIGMTSRAFQHELDHLNGIVYTAKANKIHLDRALHQQKILMRRLKRGEVYYKPDNVLTENQLREAQGQLSISTTERTVQLADSITL